MPDGVTGKTLSASNLTARDALYLQLNDSSYLVHLGKFVSHRLLEYGVYQRILKQKMDSLTYLSTPAQFQSELPGQFKSQEPAQFHRNNHQSNPNETNAYNIAISFEENSNEFNKYMQIASDLGSMPAKIAIAIKEMTNGNEEGRKLMHEPFDSLFKIYQTNKKNMSISEIDDLILTSEYLGYTDLVHCFKN